MVRAKGTVRGPMGTRLNDFVATTYCFMQCSNVALFNKAIDLVVALGLRTANLDVLSLNLPVNLRQSPCTTSRAEQLSFMEFIQDHTYRLVE